MSPSFCFPIALSYPYMALDSLELGMSKAGLEFTKMGLHLSKENWD